MTLEQAECVDLGRICCVAGFLGGHLPVRQLFDWLADGVCLDELDDFRIDQAAAEARASGSLLCHTVVAEKPVQ